MTITPESVKELLGSADFGDRLRAVNQIRQLDPSIAYDLITTATTDAHPRVRYAAVSQLASLGTQNLPETAKILRDCLTDPETDVQAAAADSLGALHLHEAFDDLQHLYHRSREWLVKFSIVAALGELGDQRAFPLLQDALSSDNELVRTAAIGSLGELGDSRAIALLTPLARDPDWQIRYRVVQALGNLDGPEARSTLEQLTQDEVEQVAQQAKFCLT